MFAFATFDNPAYPPAPFGPEERYPELGSVVGTPSATNPVYGGMRDLFHRMGWDRDRHGTPDWNPLGSFIEPGDRVVVKPNLVLHSVVGNSLESIVTHASVCRVLIDYAILALMADGSEISAPITIADVPLQSADFGRVVTEAGYRDLLAHYREQDVDVRLLDLREHWAVIDNSFFIERQVELPGDPEGTVLFDLGRESAHFSPGEDRRYSIQDYDDGATQENHAGETHRYRLSRTILGADVVLNVPKVKTHNKAGVTLAFKNMIGANVSKDYLPHFTMGSPAEGGDEYPERAWYYGLTRRVRRLLQKSRIPGSRLVWRLARWVAGRYESSKSPELQSLPHAGSWHGNDTLWRTIVDVNRLVYFGDLDGGVRSAPQRRVLHFGDGVIACEGEGPIKGRAKTAGLLCIGDDPLEFDASIAALMGFDWRKIPHLVNAAELGFTPPSEEAVRALPNRTFRPPPGWAGSVERDEAAA